MALPFFFEENLSNQSIFTLSELTSKHVVQVLRMKKGEKLKITNGRGEVIACEIIHDSKKATEVKLIVKETQFQANKKITIAISLIKNSSRFEWFLEKATEIGVTKIIPMLCERTEKQHFRVDRMQNILISAMLQSQQVWLPLLHPITKMSQVIGESNDTEKFIGHCNEDSKELLINESNKNASSVILIGPEGDFTKEEVEVALLNNFIPVSLGDTRLRTETAGIVAATLLKRGCYAH
jgi:16S rRNA (uracil1498-N3)-methyltransferase